MNKYQETRPFFTVIIPVYNKELYVKRSIKSVLEQNFKSFELIIVCDPSSDNSNAEVERFTDQRIRTYYRDEPGPGGYAARNLGIMEARSEWIAFLDADDEWCPEHLEEAYKKIINNDVNFLSFGYRIFSLGKMSDRVITDSSEDEIYNKAEALQRLFRQDVFCTNSVVIKRESLIKAGCFPDGRLYKRGGDVDTWLRVVLNEKKILISSYVTSIYHLDGSGIVSNLSNSRPPQPVVDTVKKIIDKNMQDYPKDILKILKRLSNRKQIALMVGMRNLGILKIKDIDNLYISHLSFFQIMRLFVLYVFPCQAYNKLAKLKRI